MVELCREVPGQSVCCFVETELPRNTMGKVQKNLLRQRYQHLFVTA